MGTRVVRWRWVVLAWVVRLMVRGCWGGAVSVCVGGGGGGMTCM